MKNVGLFILFFFFSIYTFSFYEMYDYFFMKPGNYFEYNSSSNGDFGLEFYTVKKYPLMDSNTLLESVWSQPRSLIGGQMIVESGNYTHAISSSKAMGLLQMKNLTAVDLYVYNLFDPYDNLKGALEYHGYLRRMFNDERLQLIAYHDGPTSVMAGNISISGERYYEKVKEAQKNYTNRKIYSPYFLGGRISYDDDKIIDGEFKAGLAYRKLELYGDISVNLNFSENTQDDNFGIDYNYTILYVPRTNVGFGIGGDPIPNKLVFRLGFPWQNFVITAFDEPSITYKHKLNEYFTSKITLNNDNLLFSGYFSIYNIDLFLGYEVFHQALNLGFRLFF